MAEKSDTGELFGVPYNFERPSVGRMLSAYWQPGDRMLIQKPFGVGYTLNLANWRSWIVLLVAGVLLWHDRNSREGSTVGDDEPSEVIVD